MRYGQPATVWGLHQVEHEQCVADSQLGDRRNLARSLAAHPGTPDVALITKAFRKWGKQAPARFVGPFSVAFADPRTSSIYLARDHMGQRPLFYALLRDKIVISLDIEAVLAHPDVTDDVDLEAVAFQFARCYRPMLRRSMFTKIAKVAPGTVLRIAGGTVSEYRYWRPEEIEPVAARPIGEHAQELRELLEIAVSDSIGTHRGVAAHVSGGLDSSAVAVFGSAVLRAKHGCDLRSVYSWAPPPTGSRYPWQSTNPDLDERRLVELVSAAQGWTVTYADPGGDMGLAHAAANPLIRPDMAWLREEWVVRHARTVGASLVLSGWGGDEAVSYGGALTLPSLLRAGALSTAVSHVRHGSGQSWPSAQLELIRGAAKTWPHVERIARTLTRTPANAYHDNQERIEALWRDQWPSVAEEMRDQRMYQYAAKSPREWQLRMLSAGHVTMRNEAWAKGSSRFSVEHRFPLQDPRVLQLALGVPATCYRSNSWSRIMFRLATQHALPPEVVWRRLKSNDPSMLRQSADLRAIQDNITVATSPEIATLVGLRKQAGEELVEAGQRFNEARSRQIRAFRR